MSQILCIFLLLVVVSAVNTVKVPVTIYYESLCPDSANFINEQLYPAVNGELKDFVDITWVPFGKATYYIQGSDISFNCQHGVNECNGNKVHACAIEHIQANAYQIQNTKESLTLDFINCMMKAGDVLPGARCALENQIYNWEKIETCANGIEGSQLLKKHGDATNHFQLPLLSVPTVVFQQQYDPEIDEAAQDDFVGTVCKYVSQPQPKICSSRNSAADNALTPFLGVLVLAVFRLF